MPPSQPLLLAIDQGTTSSRAIVFDRGGRVVAVSQHEFGQIYPRAGWVEHDPEEIWRSTLAACRDVVAKCGGAADSIAAIGIANQRETTVIWERRSGKPIHNAIVWQDRRTAERCDELKQAGLSARISEKTGLLPDAYFSATKIAWILEHVDGARRKAEAGELAFGTIDSFLIWRLTGGDKHLTDATNASRTLLFDIHKQQWDAELLDALEVPAGVLPEVLNCADHYGVSDKAVLGREIPICGVAGDQQAALFGQACFSPGMIKSTYGTGCFLMMNSGTRPVASKNRLLTTVGYRLDGEVVYALEGSIFNAGTAIQWLRDGLGLIQSTAEIDALVASTEPGRGGRGDGDHGEGNQGVYMVPAFTGLGAPHWDPLARAAIVGITRNTSKAHLVRAALEAVCYQTRDLIEAMREDGQGEISRLRVDGGMVVNHWLMQFLADITGVTVERPAITETTALGAAWLAGLQCGLFDSLPQLSRRWRKERAFQPGRDEKSRDVLIAGWNEALQRVMARDGR